MRRNRVTCPPASAAETYRGIRRHTARGTWRITPKTSRRTGGTHTSRAPVRSAEQFS